MIDRYGTPFIKIFFRFFAAFDLALGVVDQSGQFILFFFGQRAFEVLADLVADAARRAFDHMDKCLVFSVEIT